MVLDRPERDEGVSCQISERRAFWAEGTASAKTPRHEYSENRKKASVAGVEFEKVRRVRGS